MLHDEYDLLPTYSFSLDPSPSIGDDISKFECSVSLTMIGSYERSADEVAGAGSRVEIIAGIQLGCIDASTATPVLPAWI